VNPPSPSDFVSSIVALFHASVLLLGLVVLFHLRWLIKTQVRLLEAQQMQMPDPLQIRVIEAAEDWYDDKKGSKERLRAVIEQRRGIMPFRLIPR
jgi:hypothetical protein